jgi:sugar lactone lactonase YvrE
METVAEGLGYPESLRWHQGTLWFADQIDGVVRRLVPDGDGRRAEVVATIPGGASGLGWLPDGSLLVVAMAARQVHRVLPDGTTVVHADLADAAGGEGNDMLVDERGVAHVGNFGFDLMGRIRDRPKAALYAPPGVPRTPVVSFAPDGSPLGRTVPLTFPNGTVLLDDGATVVVAETLAFRLTAFRRAADGTLSDPRVWASLVPAWQWRLLTAGGLPGALARRVSALLERPAVAQRSPSPIAPDGLANGRDGSVWAANALRGECVRIAPGGRVVERVRVPDVALSCVVSGDDPSTLYVATVPSVRRDEAARLRTGAVRAVRISV